MREEKYYYEPKSQFAYRVSEDGDGFGPFIPRRKKRQNNILASCMAKIYENCAGYNVRHCHFRGFVSNKNYLTNSLKDLLILTCFLLANFVVFLAIFTRMSVQITFCIVETVKWIRRHLQTKPETRRQDFCNIINPSRTIADTRTYIDFAKDTNKYYE